MHSFWAFVSGVAVSAAADTGKALRVLPCGHWSGDTSADGWTITHGDGHFTLQNGGFCLDAPIDAVNPVATECSGVPTQMWKNHTGALDGKFQLRSVDDRCLRVVETQYTVGPGLVLDDCESGKWSNKARVWSVSSAISSGLEVISHGGFCCGDIFDTRQTCLAIDRTPTCADLSEKTWCDTTATPANRAKSLIAEMTLEEKASNMDSHNFGVPRLGIPPNVFGEALHGEVAGCGKKIDFGEYTSTGCPTSFPQVISMGASWNRSLWTAVGRAVSDEVRGLYSQQGEVGFEASLFAWSPNVNPFRDPRWGRGQEVVSEDPLAVSEFGVHYIKALQGEMESNGHKYLKMVATAKHYFDYDLEGHGSTDRQQVNVNVSKRDQIEYFVPSFRAAIERANTQSIMCSYNAVNGIPACMDDKMINGKMRGEWGFDGFVVSDCDALSDGASTRYIKENFNGSLLVQAQQGVRGGTDLNCGALYGEQNVEAVQKGLLREEELDTALERIYTKTFELGIVDGKAPSNPNPYTRLGAKDVDTPAHRALSLEAAVQSLVLLKNEDNTLPLRVDGMKKVALIGPMANGSSIFLGGPNYYGDNTIVDQYTPLLRAKHHAPDAEYTYSQGCDIKSDDESGIDAAVAVARNADEVVMFLGIDSGIENEGRDRDSLELPGVQAKLALAVAEASSKPVTVILVNGGPLAIRELKESEKVGAIVEAFFPGQFAAEAIWQVLVGEASPSGLLPVTIYDADFIDRRPITNLALRDAGGVTYRYFDGTPLWPFGFGLTYTDFEFSRGSSATVHATVAEAEAGASFCFDTMVENTGDTTSDVVLLGFISSNHDDAPRNGKLCDFARTAAVQPGEKRLVSLCANAALPLVDANGNERILPGEYRVTVGVTGGIGGAGAGSVIGHLTLDDDLVV